MAKFLVLLFAILFLFAANAFAQQQLPDLTLRDVVVGIGNTPNEIEAHAVIENIGALNAQGPITVQSKLIDSSGNFISGKETTVGVVGDLEPASSRFFSAGYFGELPAGSYGVELTIDPQQLIIEQNEINNVVQSTTLISISQPAAQTQLGGYLKLNFAVTKEFSRFASFQNNRIKFTYPNLPIFQNDAIAGYLSIGFDVSSLSERENIIKITSNNIEIGELILSYDSISKNITINSVQVINASIEASRIAVDNERVGMSNSFNLVVNGQVIGYIGVGVSLNKLSSFDANKIFEAELRGSGTQYLTEKVGDIKIDASNIDLVGIQRVQNTFSGKVKSLSGEPVTLGNVCVIAGQSPELCVRIRKSSDGSGNYAIIIEGKNKTQVSFKVNGVEAGTKELDPTTPQVTFNLQIDTSNFNFADDDKDGIPNGMDNCQDSVVQDVDIRGCDCSQKQCGVGSKCEINLFEGNKCVPVPIKRCEQKSVCIQKTQTAPISPIYNSLGDTQASGNSITYFLGSEEYEVEVISVLESANDGANSAKFKINGQETGELVVGQEFIIQNIAKLMVINITNSTNQTPAAVSFSITSLTPKTQSQNDAPKYCNSDGIVINDCNQCGCPADFTCAKSGDCIKVLTGLVGSVCKDNDFKYYLSRVNCPVGWIKEDLLRYLSVDVDGPPLIEDYAKDKVQDKLKEVTLCLKTSDLGCAPANKPYTCRFEDLLEQNRGKAAQIIESNINSQLPPASFYEELSTELRIGLGFATGGILEILNLAGLLDIEITPHVDLTGFSLRNSYDCPPKLVTSDVECLPLINNGDSNERADLVFVGDGFLDDQSFLNTVKAMIDYDGQFENTDNEGLFSIEPYKSSKTKFNIWAVNAKNKINHVPAPQNNKEGIFPDEHDVNEFASYCQNRDYTIVVSTAAYRSFCFYGGKAPCFVSIGGENYIGRLLSHELGHGFASLGDEYTNQAAELKNAPDKIEDLVTGVQTKFANCKPTDGEAQQSWGNLITQENKLGFFKACGGDCMPYCENAIRPSYLSVMNSHTLNIESKLSSRNPEGIIEGTIKRGAPFHPYYLINSNEIQKKLDDYEAGDSKDTKFYEIATEEELINTTTNSTSNCTDSDKGTNFYVKGTASSNSNSFIDACNAKVNLSGNMQYNFVNNCTGGQDCFVNEAVCIQAQSATVLVNCQNGCADGACIPLSAQPSMYLTTDKTSYDLNEKVTVISQLPSSMDAAYYFVSSAERRFIGLGGCPAAGSCFGYDRFPAGNWQAEIIAWQPNTPETAYRITSVPFTIQ